MEEQNRALIRTLYDSLDRHDGEGMAACYAPTAQFRDPAFGELSGAEAGDMWRMLTGRAEDLSVELADHDANDETGTAHWIAHYTFTDTGRPVVNDVRARFRFADGLIVEHVDRAFACSDLGQTVRNRPRGGKRGFLGGILGQEDFAAAVEALRKLSAALDELDRGGSAH